MRPGDFFDYVPLGRARLRPTTAIDLVLGVGAAVVMAAWLVGRPVLYSTSAPVMSPFTARSLFIMMAVRQARLHLETWPMVLSLPMTGLVLRGNVSSILTLSAAARVAVPGPRLEQQRILRKALQPLGAALSGSLGQRVVFRLQRSLVRKFAWAPHVGTPPLSRPDRGRGRALLVAVA